VGKEFVVGGPGKAVDLGPSVEESIDRGALNGEWNAGSGVGFRKSLRENIDSSV